jgi:hypothetical protein
MKVVYSEPGARPILDGVWWIVQGMRPENLGYLPDFIEAADPRSMREQINDRYVSGWSPFEGFTFDKRSFKLSYPGDPPMFPVAGTFLREEVLLLYPHDWVLILQPDGSWEAARLD